MTEPPRFSDIFAKAKNTVQRLDRALDNLSQPSSNISAVPPQNSTPIPLKLVESVSVTLNSQGTGSAMYSPKGTRMSGYTETIDSVAVSCQPVSPNTQVINNATASTYLSWGVQSAGPNDFQGSTITGSTGDTDSINQTLQPNDWITTTWIGGDAGAVCTMRLYGSVNPPGYSGS